jgi:hypothetical protein
LVDIFEYMIDVCKVSFGLPGGKDQLGDVSADGRELLNWALKKWTILCAL